MLGVVGEVLKEAVGVVAPGQLFELYLAGGTELPISSRSTALESPLSAPCHRGHLEPGRTDRLSFAGVVRIVGVCHRVSLSWVFQSACVQLSLPSTPALGRIVRPVLPSSVPVSRPVPLPLREGSGFVRAFASGSVTSGPTAPRNADEKPWLRRELQAERPGSATSAAKSE